MSWLLTWRDPDTITAQAGTIKVTAYLLKHANDGTRYALKVSAFPARQFIFPTATVVQFLNLSETEGRLKLAQIANDWLGFLAEHPRVEARVMELMV